MNRQDAKGFLSKALLAFWRFNLVFGVLWDERK